MLTFRLFKGREVEVFKTLAEAKAARTNPAWQIVEFNYLSWEELYNLASKLTPEERRSQTVIFLDEDGNSDGLTGEIQDSGEGYNEISLWIGSHITH